MNGVPADELIDRMINGVLPWFVVLLGAWILWSRHVFLRGAQPVTGTVVHVQVNFSTDCDSADTYRPIFRFQWPDGTIDTGTTTVATSWWNFSKGTRKKILVNPRHPGEVWLPSLSTVPIAVACVFTGLFFAMKGWPDLKALLILTIEKIQSAL